MTYDHWKTTNPEDEYLGHDPDEDEGCWNCGGEGFLEGLCTCGEDTCCCLEPEPPICPECKGKGYLS